MTASGKVSLVGAGPGDPGLITVAGLDRLRAADVIVYDRLVAPALLEHARPEAELIYVGKVPSVTLSGDETRARDKTTAHPEPCESASRRTRSDLENAGGDATTSERRTAPSSHDQPAINALLIEKAREGKAVVRLKGGDPFVFGRGGEEAEALRAAGIPFEIIPGVTSAIAVPAYAGIPVTHRGVASSFAVITGHEAGDPVPPSPAHGRGAGGEGSLTTVDTLVFLMGTKTLPDIVAKLIADGRPADTPVAVIHRGTTPEQRTITGTLADIADRVEDAGLTPPAITVVGDVVRLRETISWFAETAAGPIENRPLFGKRVLITRSRKQASTLARLLAAEGAIPIELPAIEIEPTFDPATVTSALDDLVAGRYTWAVFTSANAVDIWFDLMRERGLDARAFGRQSTRLGGRQSIRPGGASATHVGDPIRGSASQPGSSAQGSSSQPDTTGTKVTAIGPIRGSGSQPDTTGTRVAAIGPATAKALAERGITPDLVPPEYIAEALADALLPRLDASPLPAHPEALVGASGATTPHALPTNTNKQSAINPRQSAAKFTPGDRILLPRAEGARPELLETLRSAGATVDEVTLYRAAVPIVAQGPSPQHQPSVNSQLSTLNSAHALALLRNGDIDIVTFTSSSTVRNLAALLNGDLAALTGTPPLSRASGEGLGGEGPLIACIGPITAQTARDLGLRVDVVASEHTVQGLVGALRECIRREEEV